MPDIRPTCFISYSWDNDDHRDWVHKLSEDLRAANIDVSLDRDVRPGASVTQFMESALRQSDVVLIICTPRYAEKANERIGGVGYETGIVTGELYQLAPERKFIPLIRNGNPAASLPTYLADRLGVDFRLEENYSNSLQTLIQDIHGEPTLANANNDNLEKDELPPAPDPVADRVPSPPSVPSLGTTELHGILDTETRPVVIEFWAPWCGPCRVLAPIIDELAVEYSHSTRFARVNVDEEQAFAAEHEVLSIPTMSVFQKSRPTKKIVGAMPKSRLLQELDGFIGEPDSSSEEDDMVALTWHEGGIRAVLLNADGTYSYISSDASKLGLVYLPKFVKSDFAATVAELEELLNDSYTTKDTIRAFLEEHPDIILGGEYKAAYPQVLLRRDGIQPLRPDFMLKPLAGELADIVEIEPAQKGVVDKVDGVAELSEVVMQACARLRDYRDYFEEERHRVEVEDAHGIRAFRPRMFVVIGRSGQTDALTKRRLETQFSDVTLRSWDEVLAVARSRLD